MGAGGCCQGQNVEIKDNTFFRQKTMEKSKYLQDIQTKEEELFMKYYNNMKEKDIVLKNLILNQDIYFALINNMLSNDSVESITFSNILFEEKIDVLLQLFHIVKDIHTIKHLCFEFLSNLGNKKGKSLYEIVKKNLGLQSLILRELDLDKEDAEFLGRIIAKCTDNLTRIEIESIQLFEYTNYLLDGFNVNNCIKELYLNKIGLKWDNFEFLISALSTNSCLVILDVSNNPIGKGTDVLIQFPLENLNELIMNNCNIDDNAFASLCEGLIKCKKVETIELNYNGITQAAKSVCALKKLFEKNGDVIAIMSMKNNEITREDIEEFIDGSDLKKILIDSEGF